MASFGFLGGHLGSSVSALVDGQLSAEDSERAWDHVSTCLPCRRLVEHEGWVKQQLAQVSGPHVRGQQPPDQLLGSLLDLDPAGLGEGNPYGDVAWEQPDPGRTRRRAGLVLVGAGSVSAAVLGLTALSGSPLQLGGSGGPATSIGGGTRPSPTTTVVTPAAAVHGRLRGWTVEHDSRGTHAVPRHP